MTRLQCNVAAACFVVAWSYSPEAWAQPSYKQIEGRGDSVVDIPALEAGLLIIAAAHQGTSNFTLVLFTAAGARRGNVVNTIGQYGGMRVMPVTATAHTLQVKADGQWRIRYEQPRPDGPADKRPTNHEAKGDLVLGPIELSPGLVRATLTHQGKSNFVVVLYHISGQRIGSLVNEIGPYSGTVAQQIRQPGRYYLDVQADGQWTFNMP